ncbi:MAG: diacylglycerol kinase family protein [Bacteroidia bacterium]|nr:diacylglycerol kinase family protein [Bacteroidia bacterium]
MSFFTNRIKSFGNALNGIYLAFSSEIHLKIHLTAIGLVIIAGFYYSVSILEWCILFLCIASVVVTEMINTAIEHLANFIHQEYNYKIAIIKDISAGAVLFAAIIASIIAAIIFIPKMY